MSDTDKDKPLEQESKKFLETDTVTPSVPEKKVDKKVKVDGKEEIRIQYSTYPLSSCHYSVLRWGTVLYFRHFNELYFNGPPPPPDDKMSQIPNILPLLCMLHCLPSRYCQGCRHWCFSIPRYPLSLF